MLNICVLCILHSNIQYLVQTTEAVHEVSLDSSSVYIEWLDKS